MTVGVDIERNIGTYLGDLRPLARYASFDYCFNYFQVHREDGRLNDLLHGEALQLSCLHLSFYFGKLGNVAGFRPVEQAKHACLHSGGGSAR